LEVAPVGRWSLDASTKVCTSTPHIIRVRRRWSLTFLRVSLTVVVLGTSVTIEFPETP
jgi:hypothetical protein